MKPRNALIVLPSLGRGGAERHAVWVATQLDRDRWRPSVLAFGEGPFARELEQSGVPVEIVPATSRRSLRARAAAVRAAVRQVQPALVSGHHIMTEVAIRSAIRGSDLPYLAWKHTYGHVGHRGVRERLFERVTGHAVTRYGAVCHSQVRYLTDALGLPADRIAVVPNSVPVPAEVVPSPDPVVLMVAAMRADKDHATVLRAWPAVLERIPDARLLLAGDGRERPALETLAGASGIRSSVEFLGLRGDVGELLRRSRLLVLASYAVECFPYAVLEAMAAGRGVVSTDVAGLPELVDDGATGRLVVPRDEKGLAAGIVEGLTGGGALADRWGAAGRERVRTVFPFGDWARRISALFDDVAGPPGLALISSARKDVAGHVQV